MFSPVVKHRFFPTDHAECWCPREDPLLHRLVLQTFGCSHSTSVVLDDTSMPVMFVAKDQYFHSLFKAESFTSLLLSVTWDSPPFLRRCFPHRIADLSKWLYHFSDYPAEIRSWDDWDERLAEQWTLFYSRYEVEPRIEDDVEERDCPRRVQRGDDGFSFRHSLRMDQWTELLFLPSLHVLPQLTEDETKV